MSEFTSCISDIAVAVAALATGGSAVYGVNRWRREIKGRAAFETARGLLRATYILRDQITSCRHPFISVSEFPNSFNKNNNPIPTETADAYRHVYKNRWKPIAETISEFDVHDLEAQVLWGNDVKERTDKLRECVQEIKDAIGLFIENVGSDGEYFQNDRNWEKSVKNTIYDAGKNNEVSNKIKNAITGIEEKIRPHLKH